MVLRKTAHDLYLMVAVNRRILHEFIPYTICLPNVINTISTQAIFKKLKYIQVFLRY
jgi:hypothetical protein